MKIFGLLCAVSLISVVIGEDTSAKKCYAPVVCSQSKQSTTDWRQVYPPQCKDCASCSGSDTDDKKTEDSSIITTLINGMCMTWFNKKCFMAFTGKYDRSEAEAFCATLNGVIANIYNATHMEFVESFLKNTRVVGTSGIEFRLGMTFNPITKTISLRDGEDAPSEFSSILSTRNGTLYSEYTDLFLTIVPTADSKLTNHLPSTKASVICEI